jgi:hypothetical protein
MQAERRRPALGNPGENGLEERRPAAVVSREASIAKPAVSSSCRISSGVARKLVELSSAQGVG